MRAFGFGIVLVLAFSVLLFGCLGGGQQATPAPTRASPSQVSSGEQARQTPAASVEASCGYAADLLSTEKLLAAGFKGTASVQRSKDTRKPNYCVAQYNILQDDCVSFMVFLTDNFGFSVESVRQDYTELVKTADIAIETNVFGEKSTETYMFGLDDKKENAFLMELDFYKGKTLVRVLVSFKGMLSKDRCYPQIAGSSEEREKILGNAKLIAKLVDGGI